MCFKINSQLNGCSCTFLCSKHFISNFNPADLYSFQDITNHRESNLKVFLEHKYASLVDDFYGYPPPPPPKLAHGDYISRHIN